MVNKKELIVSAISDGTVIDHITHGNTLRVLSILNLENFQDQIYIGANLDSKKYGKKGIIKVHNRFFESDEINKIALVAPTATLIEIRDYDVVKKAHVEIPDTIKSFVKCVNPKCVTNHENIPTHFSVIDKEDLKLHCHYCEKITKKETIEFK